MRATRSKAGPAKPPGMWGPPVERKASAIDLRQSPSFDATGADAVDLRQSPPSVRENGEKEKKAEPRDGDGESPTSDVREVSPPASNRKASPSKNDARGEDGVQ